MELQIYFYFVSLIVFLIAIGVYWNCLEGEFLFDDGVAIKDNKDIRNDETSWYQLWINDFWGSPYSHPMSHKSYRPITVLSFRFNYAIHGLNVFGFHFTNVMLHAFVSLLVFILGNHSLRFDSLISAIAAIIFALHPIHTEAVANNVGRAELLSALFFLFALIVFIHPTHTTSLTDINWKRMALSNIFVILSFLSKEPGITAYGCFLAYDLSVIIFNYLNSSSTSENDGRRKNELFVLVRYLIKKHLLFFVTGILYLGLRRYLGGGITFLRQFNRHEAPLIETEGISQWLSIFYLQSYYFWLLLFPLHLSAEYSYNCIPMISSLLDFRNIFTLSYFIIILTIFWYLLPQMSESNTKNTKPKLKSVVANDLSPFFMLMMMIITFLPASQVFFLIGTTIGERLLYLPSIGYCYLLTILLFKISQYLATKSSLIWTRNTGNNSRSENNNNTLNNNNNNNSTVLIMFLLSSSIMIAMGIRTIERNHDWHDYDSIWESAEKVCPNSAKVVYSKSLTYIREKKFDEAEKLLRRSISIADDLLDSHWRLGKVMFAKQNNTGAIYHFQKCINLNDQFNCHIDIAIVYAVVYGRYNDSSHVLEQVLTSYPQLKRTRNIHFNLGTIYAKMGKYGNAIQHLEIALKHVPNGVEYLNNLAGAYFESGKEENLEKAISILKQATVFIQTSFVMKNLEYLVDISKSNSKSKSKSSSSSQSQFHFKYAFVMDGIGTLYQ